MNVLEIDLQLPDHTTELEETDTYIKDLKLKLNDYKKNVAVKPMSKKQHSVLYEEIIRGLYYLGYLSLPAFDVEDKIEEEYFKTYKHSPELAKELWWKHYESIHLDELYISIYKCPPPDYVE